MFYAYLGSNVRTMGVRQGKAKLATIKTGPNDTSGIVWAIVGFFSIFFDQLIIYYSIFRFY